MSAGRSSRTGEGTRYCLTVVGAAGDADMAAGWHARLLQLDMYLAARVLDAGRRGPLALGLQVRARGAVGAGSGRHPPCRRSPSGHAYRVRDGPSRPGDATATARMPGPSSPSHTANGPPRRTAAVTASAPRVDTRWSDTVARSNARSVIGTTRTSGGRATRRTERRPCRRRPRAGERSTPSAHHAPAQPDEEQIGRRRLELGQHLRERRRLPADLGEGDRRGRPRSTGREIRVVSE